MPDPERAQAIENNVNRTLRFAADELSRSPDRTASMVEQAAKQLDSSDAKEHLSPETRERLLAQVAALRKQVEDAERAEKAQRIERDIKRVISNLEDEIRTSGSQVESYLERAATRLASAEAREYLTADALAALQQQLAELRSKAGLGGSPEPAKPVTPPAREPIAATTPPPKVNAQPPTVQPSVDTERARAIENDIARLVKFAADELNGPGWQQAASYAERAARRLESEDTLQHLSTETLDRLKGQIADIQAQLAARDRAEHVERIQERMQRLISDAEQSMGRRDYAAGMLERALEALESEDAVTYLPAEVADNYRREIARIKAMISGAQKQKALAAVTEPLEELERLVSGLNFEGMDSYDAQKLGSELERFQRYAETAITELSPDEGEIPALRARLKKAQESIAAAWATAQRNELAARLAAAWDETQTKIAGWDEETQDTSANALGAEILPNTREALTELRTFLTNDLFSPVPKARTEYPDDASMQAIIAAAERVAGAMVSKIVTAFDAILDAAEQLPTPSNKNEREKADRMRLNASSLFQHTDYLETRMARAGALYQKWEDEIEAERQTYLALYNELTAQAEAAWPAIDSKIEAHDGFDPFDSKWRGKRVRMNAIRNRIGWDFGGPFDFAIWVGEMPVVGNFEPGVREAVNSAVERTRNQIDDHTDWDAVIVVGGPGKIKQRFRMKVKKDGHEVGEIEEWRPVDCIMCDVIALRAGPVAIGPEL